MRNGLYAAFLAFVLAFAAPAWAGEANAPRPKDSVELTGSAWLASSYEEKASFLLGVEMAIATEQYIAERVQAAAKEKKTTKTMSVVSPSPFAKGWLRVFKDTTRPELIAKLDTLIEGNAGVAETHIFEIIWNEYLEPAGKAARKAGGK